MTGRGDVRTTVGACRGPHHYTEEEIDGKVIDEIADRRAHGRENRVDEEGDRPNAGRFSRPGLQGSQEHLRDPRTRQARLGEPQGPHGTESADRCGDQDPREARRQVPRGQSRQGRHSREQETGTFYFLTAFLVYPDPRASKERLLFHPPSILFASVGRDGHGGFRHSVICRSVARAGAVAPFCWSVRRTANRETHKCRLAPSHYGEPELPAIRQPKPPSVLLGPKGSLYVMREMCELRSEQIHLGRLWRFDV